MKRALKATLEYFKKADVFLLILCCLCSILGIVLIWSATKASGGSNVYIQTLSLFIGLICFVLFSIIDVETIANRWKFLSIFSTLFLLSLLVIGTGSEETGNQSWIRFLGIGIQPSEVVKIIFIILMAYHIQYLKEYKNLNSFFSLIQLIVHFGFVFVVLMISSRDLGNGLVYLFIFAVMLFLGGVQFRWFLLFGAAGGALIPLLNKYVLQDYQRDRILAPYIKSIDPTNTGANYQAYRSKIAIASGGWTGQGLGQGTQTQSVGGVPEQETDFIFSVAGEELGLIGCLAIFILLTLVIIRCFYVASQARNTLSALTCAGIGAFMLFQSLENIGMCLGLTPVVGITLPFFSYGGSSLVTTFIAMGLVCGVKMRTVSPWKRRLG